MALKELKRLASDENAPLRIGVKRGGCAGMEYILNFEAMNEDDEMWTFEELKVVMHKEHRETLHGVVIDFEMGLSNRGFTYQNPNASTTCGCGTSFS
ncbi:MAG: iron-sulfur cluster assembly accessory protein [Bacteroidota bacterium]|nr:iron-sulfur cluster assembly accessory protein [Bacteroidota bacterium]